MFARPVDKRGISFNIPFFETVPSEVIKIKIVTVNGRFVRLKNE